jgi:uncharacterized membrane protein (GlpM family)
MSHVPALGHVKEPSSLRKNYEIAGQIPLVPSLASGVRYVSGQYAASSGGEGGKFLAALTIQEQRSTIQKEH